jgi:tRNA A-37 threonylcarbamoyl transferase component Bud32
LPVAVGALYPLTRAMRPAANTFDDALAAGTQVGDYVVTGFLGEGGMATVYSGEHPLIGKKVAIKVIRAELCRSADAIDRFVQEARAANEIGHPNLVDVFNFGELPDGRSYFVMEWLQGRTLADILDNDGPLPLGAAARALCEICDGLHAAHGAGVVHRDLKPQNVFFVEGGKVKLLDFGIAKLVGKRDNSTPNTQPGLTMGTPDYISPEQARGRNVDARADVYSLGVLAFEMTTGQLPFVADNPADMMAMHLGAAPRKPGAVNPALPPGFDALIARMLDKDAERRPSIPEVRAALTDILYPPLPALPSPPRSRTKRPMAHALIVAGAGLCAAVTAALVSGGKPLLPAIVALSATPIPGRLAVSSAPIVAPAAAAAPETPVQRGGVIIVRPRPDNATVLIDGERVPVEEGRARQTFAEPGTHLLTVTAPGHRKLELEIAVEEGRYVVVPVRLGRLPRAAMPASTVAPAAAAGGPNLASDDFRTIDPWAKRP